MIALFDIGGTSIKYGLVDPEREAFALEEQGETDSNAKVIGGQGILRKIIWITEQFNNRYTITGIAISTAGMIDAEKGVVQYANENIPEYTGLQIKDMLEERFRVPCWLENDVNAAALGEYYFGAGKDAQSLLMLTIGTGIGGALVLNGHVYHGHSNSAGEVGYMWIRDFHYEDIASTTALVKNVEMQRGETNLNGRTIFQMAEKNDAVCKKEIEELCRNIACGIANCVCLINPETVILGGGIMAQKDILEPLVRKYLKVYLNEELYMHTRLGFAELKNTAGLAGAYSYYCMKEKTGERSSELPDW